MGTINTPGSCQVIYAGYVEPCNIDQADLDIRDIAHCLASAPRWSGLCNDLTEERNPVHYSVAQHSCIVHDIVARSYKKIIPNVQWDILGIPSPAFYGLMHDASEAYICDIPRPIKKLIRNYYEIEADLMRAIIEKFQIPYNEVIKEAVRRVDNAMIFWERDALIGHPVSPYENENEHPGSSLQEVYPGFRPWDAKLAKREFLTRFVIHYNKLHHVPVSLLDETCGDGSADIGVSL